MKTIVTLSAAKSLFCYQGDSSLATLSQNDISLDI